MSQEANRYVYDLSRTELLDELRRYWNDPVHTASRGGPEVLDPEGLRDDELRELLKVVRWRVLLRRQREE